MENTELLQQMLAAIEQNNKTLLKEIRGEIREGQEALRTEIREGQEALRAEFREGQEVLRNSIIDQVTKAMSAQSEMLLGKIDQKVSEAETRINIKIEHEIDRQLKALFDGYQLNYDKNVELDKRTEKLDSRIERLEIRMDVLEEHRTAKR